MQWAKARGVGLVVEALDFIHDQDVSAKFNRVTHQFTSRAFLTALARQAAREGVEVRKVKPAYTSMIGRFKYQPQYGISVHHAAALVIGRTSRKPCVSGCKTAINGTTPRIANMMGVPGLGFNGS